MPEGIAGVDEAGRGPLAGPVYAACVMLDPARPIVGVADSKKLSAKARQDLAATIREQALAWAVAWATAAEIDQLNILQASLLAMERAVGSLSRLPGEVWVDGPHCPKLAIPARGIVGGDASVPVISAASILAKVARDAAMAALHQDFPDYGFDRHKGYPTADHLRALERHGPCPEHRRSFAPVRKRLADPRPGLRDRL